MSAAAPVAETVATSDKAVRFKTIATRRGKSAIHQIRLLANTARSELGYEHTEEQVDTLLSTLRNEIDKLEAAFRAEPKQPVQLEL